MNDNQLMRYNTAGYSFEEDSKDMTFMVWFVYRFFAAQGIPLCLHLGHLLYFTGHTPAMIRSIKIDGRFMPTLKDENGNKPNGATYHTQWTAEDFGIPCNASQHRSFPLPPGMIPSGAEDHECEHWGSVRFPTERSSRSFGTFRRAGKSNHLQQLKTDFLLQPHNRTDPSSLQPMPMISWDFLGFLTMS